MQAAIQDLELESPQEISISPPKYSPDYSQMAGAVGGHITPGGVTSSHFTESHVTFHEDSKSNAKDSDETCNLNGINGQENGLDITDQSLSAEEIAERDRITREEMVSKVKKEILMMRQVSEQLESDHNDRHRLSVARMAFLVGGIALATAAVVMYMRTKQGRLF